jgi:L-erythro-3,5-diaminohexanoate dehydrogenase
VTVVVVNASGCEPAAALLTAEGGTVLFFSMATRFSAVALAADGIGAELRMIIGSGYAPDHGDYALELVRTSEALREAVA